jgi:hypothetical protein
MVESRRIGNGQGKRENGNGRPELVSLVRSSWISRTPPPDKELQPQAQAKAQAQAQGTSIRSQQIDKPTNRTNAGLLVSSVVVVLWIRISVLCEHSQVLLCTVSASYGMYGMVQYIYSYSSSARYDASTFTVQYSRYIADIAPTAQTPSIWPVLRGSIRHHLRAHIDYLADWQQKFLLCLSPATSTLHHLRSLT